MTALYRREAPRLEDFVQLRLRQQAGQQRQFADGPPLRQRLFGQCRGAKANPVLDPQCLAS